MADKKYAVVTVPKDDQSDVIQLTKTEIFESWDDAVALISHLYTMNTGRDIPKLKSRAAISLETPVSYIQMWICDIPVLEPKNYEDADN